MTKEIRSPNTEGRSGVRSPDSSFGFRYSFGFRHSSFVIRIWELRFMESPLSIVRMHWDHEPKMRNLFICKGSILRFMESPLSIVRMHWDHEPTPSPSKEGSNIRWPVPLLGGVRGGLVRARFMERE